MLKRYGNAADDWDDTRSTYSVLEVPLWRPLGLLLGEHGECRTITEQEKVLLLKPCCWQFSKSDVKLFDCDPPSGPKTFPFFHTATPLVNYDAFLFFGRFKSIFIQSATHMRHRYDREEVTTFPIKELRLECGHSYCAAVLFLRGASVLLARGRPKRKHTYPVTTMKDLARNTNC